MEEKDKPLPRHNDDELQVHYHEAENEYLTPKTFAKIYPGITSIPSPAIRKGNAGSN
jgi:hypothetical protein